MLHLTTAQLVFIVLRCYFYCASYKNIQTLHGYIFFIFQHFLTNLCMFTSFLTCIAAVVLDSGLPAWMEMQSMAAFIHK